MIFQQLFDAETSTYSYLIASENTRQAALIDSVDSDVGRYLDLLQSLNLLLLYTLKTHVHADHITAAGRLRGSKSILHRSAGVNCADVLVDDSDFLQLGELQIEVRHTPGHTQGCVSYVLEDRVFTGDALLIGGCGRTDFQQGDAGQLYDGIVGKLFSLLPQTLVYPGHDYHGNRYSTIAKEIVANPRLGGGRGREDFIALMSGLKLDYPKRIAEALPANLACGAA